MTTDNVIDMLKQECQRAGSQTKWAKAHGVHRSLVSRILQGKNPLEPSVILALGLRRAISYEPRLT